jgi:hypothetical protein
MLVDLLSDGMQPCIQRLPKVCVAQGCNGASALGMSADDHLLHLEMRDRTLDHTCRNDVVVVHCIRDVAVHEDVARLAVADGRLGNAASRRSRSHLEHPVISISLGARVSTLHVPWVHTVSRAP